MSAKKKQTIESYGDPPKTLKNHPFYGLKLDEDQLIFRDAIWDPKNLIVFANCKAGTGKTLIAVATANLLVQYGFYDGIIYEIPQICSKNTFMGKKQLGRGHIHKLNESVHPLWQCKTLQRN